MRKLLLGLAIVACVGTAPARAQEAAAPFDADLQRFAETMREGDLVVLRSGTSGVFGVGEVVGPYAHSELFGDVDGWSLQHLRRVRWLWHDRSAPKSFGTYALKLGDTTQELGSGPVRDWMEGLAIPAENFERRAASRSKPSGISRSMSTSFPHSVQSA